MSTLSPLGPIGGIVEAVTPGLFKKASSGVIGPKTTELVHKIAHPFSRTTAPIGSSPSGTIHGGKIPKLSPKEHMQLLTGHRHHRRINPGNFKALARAERRVKRFVDKATKLIRWVHPHKLGHAVPRFHKKKRRK